jgi:hypothetical protein
MTTENQFIEYKLRDWINRDNLKWVLLAENPNAIPLLENNTERIMWFILSSNPNAIHLLEKNLDRVGSNYHKIQVLFIY